MITLISHFYNEELLIEDWVRHHIPLFDRAILINHNSTDRSVEIARSVMPDTWEIVDTKLPDFGAIGVDNEVMDIEATLDGWKMALNTTEYLFCADFRDRLQRLESEHPGIQAFGCRPLSLVDVGYQPIESPIWRNRHHGFLNYGEGNPVHRQWRFVHKGVRGEYTPGRHDTNLTKFCDPEFYHLHLLFSPWPFCIPRKMQIQTRIPLFDRRNNMGVQHYVDEALLEKRWNEAQGFSYDLMTLPVFKENYEAFLRMRNEG